MLRHTGNFVARRGCSVVHRVSARLSYNAEFNEPATQWFSLSSGEKIAYKKTPGTRHPGVIFIPGLLANMSGQKAKILEQYCHLYNHPFIRFDYQGIGESTGDLQAATPMIWLNNALTVLDTLTEPGQPQILVGSSMGGLLMLHIAMRRPEKVFGAVGIALPFDYPSRVANAMTEKMLDDLKTHGSVHSGRGDFRFSVKFLEDGLKLGFNHENRIKVTCPVRLLHGTKDNEVPWDLSSKLLSLLDAEDVHVILSKSADHRFSEPQDLQILVNTVDQLLKQYEHLT